MNSEKTKAERRNQQTTWMIRVVLIIALLVLTWPIPAMVGYESRTEGQVFGRYTVRYFAFMATYLLSAGGWLLITIGALVGLNRRRLETIRTWIEKHVTAVTVITAATIEGLIGLRILLLRGIIHFPHAFASKMSPVVMAIWLATAVLASLLADSRIVQAIDGQIGKSVESLRARPLFRPIAAIKPGMYTTIGLVGIAGLLTLVAVKGHFAQQPPFDRDVAAHIYLGQLIMRGGTPYVDLIYFHPPLRFGLSWLINVIATTLRLPLVPTFHIFSYLLSIGVIASVYLIGKELLGSRSGGLFSAVVLLGIDHLQLLLLNFNPNFIRLTTLLLMLLGVWLAQRKRWFWSTALITLSALTWAPAAAGIGAVIISGIVSREENKRRAILSAVGGAGLVLALTAAVLAGAGILETTFIQTVKSVWRFGMIRASTNTELGSDLGPLMYILLNFIFRNNWELLIFIAVGPVLMTIKRGCTIFRESTFSMPLIGGLIMLVLFAIDNQGSIRDGVMFSAVLVPFGAATISTMIPAKAEGPTPHAYGFFALLALVFLLVLGLADNSFTVEAAQPSLAEREFAAAEINAMLEPSDQVQYFYSPEFLIYSGRINALPVFSWGGKTDVYKLVGWTDDRIAEQLEAIAPVIVEGPEESYIATEWFSNHYTKVIDRENGDIYVRSDRGDLIEALSEQAETFK
ncbi:MAG: hypothetical protein JXJ17_10265 [Anaerolineae bacterium]|nr:hypothetical protein [Anaerolineae bacterium]